MLMSAFVLLGILDWNGWVRHFPACRASGQFDLYISVNLRKTSIIHPTI